MRVVVDSHIPNIRGLIEPLARVDYLEPDEITPASVADADALIIRTRTRCDATLLEGSRVRFIGSATIGTDHIDLPYCSSRGITVRNAPGCNAPAVAQWVMAAIAVWMNRHAVTDPRGLTLGVVGVGHIGSIVARWARQLGFTVLLNDPPRENRDGSFDDIFLPLEELQRRCDIITFHTPLTRDGEWPTWHLCDQRFLDGLEQCRLLLNAARGPIADNVALLRWHGDLGLDCWENEPRISLPLLDKCLVATPHIAGYSREGKQRGTAMMLAALNAHFGWSIPLPHVAAPALGARDITLAALAASYDILADTARLKSALTTAEGAAPTVADGPAPTMATHFESLRNNYPHRPEFNPHQ